MQQLILMMISSSWIEKSVVLILLFKGALIPKLPIIFSTTRAASGVLDLDTYFNRHGRDALLESILHLMVHHSVVDSIQV